MKPMMLPNPIESELSEVERTLSLSPNQVVAKLLMLRYKMV